MYEACEEARNKTELDTSSTDPNLRMGTIFLYSLTCSLARSLIKSVSIKPGETQLTVIFFLAVSLASVLVSPICPAFDAA